MALLRPVLSPTSPIISSTTLKSAFIAAPVAPTQATVEQTVQKTVVQPTPTAPVSASMPFKSVINTVGQTVGQTVSSAPTEQRTPPTSSDGAAPPDEPGEPQYASPQPEEPPQPPGNSSAEDLHTAAQRRVKVEQVNVINKRPTHVYMWIGGGLLGVYLLSKMKG
jgi:hypothetical protein